jgi:ubiquinone biosynthesis protein
MDKPQNEISMARLLGQLFQITETFAMETQPQLLMLQKTMLVAEGTGRKLCPDVNMWLLARPLIQSWMVEHLSPDARMRETMGEMAANIARLPELLALAEKSASMLADGRVRLHPETVQALRGGNGGRTSLILIWVVLAALIGVVLFG